MSCGLALRLPDGDPADLAGFVRTLRAVAGELDVQQARLGAEQDRLGSCWSGPASTAARVTLDGLAAQAGTAQAAMSAAAGAVAAHSAALDDARAEVLALRTRLSDADADLRHGLSVVRSTELDPMALYRAEQVLHTEHAQRVRAVQQAHDQLLDDLDRSAQRLRRTLEDTRGPFVRDHRQSVEDYAAGIATALLGTLPVLREHRATVAALVWASMTSAPGAVARVGRTGRLLVDHAAAVRAAGSPLASVPLTPTYQPWWLRLAAGRSEALAAALHGDNLLTGATAARGQSLMTLWSSRAGTAGFARSVGVLRGLGVVGSAGATVVSGLNVVSQGNPVHAFQDNGAGYVADVGETLFHGSVTALLLAPNPVTAGAVVVTGVVYVGAELYAHREQLAALAGDGVQLAVDVGRASLEVADDVLDTVGGGLAGGVDAVGDGVRAVGSALNPFG